MKEVIIKENWAAIEEAEMKAKEITGDPEAGFNANLFQWSGRQLSLPIMYRKKKGKKGEESFTQSYFDIMTIAKFCPFTGKPLYKHESGEVNVSES